MRRHTPQALDRTRARAEFLVPLHEPLGRADVAEVVHREQDLRRELPAQRHQRVDDPIVRMHDLRALHTQYPAQPEHNLRIGEWGGGWQTGIAVQERQPRRRRSHPVHAYAVAELGLPCGLIAVRRHRDIVSTLGERYRQVADMALFTADHWRVELSKQ
jgi:hypothetical protein